MEDEVQPKVPKIGIRHGQVVLQMLFYVIIWGIQSSVSISVIYMIDPNPREISKVLPMFFGGFILFGLFSGPLTKKFGFKWPMVILMIIISVVTINLPILSKNFGYIGLMVGTFIQGLCTGLGFAMPSEFVSKWIPMQERTFLGTAVYASPRFANIFGLLLSFYFVSIHEIQYLYTQFGLLAIIWAILMAAFGGDNPEEFSRSMSISELNYIIDNRGSIKPKSMIVTPWKQIFTSSSFWAIVVAQIGASWLTCVLGTSIPFYMRYNFKFRDLLIPPAFIPLISWISSFVLSGITQHLINREKITVEQSRKILNSIGTFIPAFLLILFIFLSGGMIEGYILLTILSISSIGSICGSKININDISPNYAPIIFCISEWIGTVFSIITLQIILIEKGIDNWTFMFSFTAILLLITNCFYIKFGSGEEQKWDTYATVLDEEANLSKSVNYVSCEESKYLLFANK